MHNRDPRGEWEDAVTGHSEDEARRSYYGHRCVLLYLVSKTCFIELGDTYKPEGRYADDVHENVPALSEYNRVERHERLG